MPMSVMLPLFRYPSVTFPNLDGIANAEGRWAFRLLSAETGPVETILGSGVDVLSFPEEKESSDVQPPDEDESYSVDCTETSDSSSLKQSLWDADCLLASTTHTLIKPVLMGSDTEPFTCVTKYTQFQYSQVVLDARTVHTHVILIY